MRERNGSKKAIGVLLVFALICICAYVFISDNFEREEPQIEIADTIYWNTRDKIKLELSDNQMLKNIKIEYSKNNEESYTELLNKELDRKVVNLELALKKPAFNEKISSYNLKITATDTSLWQWFGGNKTQKNVRVVIDSKRPNVSILANSYSITKGGSASVVFYAHDENLKELYIDINGRRFNANPYIKKDFYVALLAWDLRQSAFSANIIAVDLAGNVTKEHIPYFQSNKQYKLSNISINDQFIDGKIKDLYELNSAERLDSKAQIFDYVNAKLRGQNDEIIRKITTQNDNKIVDSYYLKPFIPLRGAKKVADFGDHRYYKYKGEQISNSYHLGLDLASTKMAPILLSNEGEIAFAQDNGIYGLNILVNHGLGLYTLYGHCSKKSVNVGQVIPAGAQIANTGTSGLALGDHLHFGVLVQGIEVRPEEWMDARWMKNNIFDILHRAKSIIEKGL